MDKLKLLLASRKFWASVAGVLSVLLSELVPSFPLDSEQVSNLVFVLAAFILGTGLEDGLRASGFALKSRK